MAGSLYTVKQKLIMKINIMNSLTIVSLVFSLLACGNKNKATSDKNTTKSAVITVAVSGTVTQTNSYCGGARPPDEILTQLATPRPFPDKKFHVIKGETNTVNHEIILSFTTDSVGNFSFKVPAGTYSIILDEQTQTPDAKKYQTQFLKMDEACFKDWWAKPYYLLEVSPSSQTTTIKGLNFEFHHRCFIQYDIPCLQYSGPLPP